MKTEEKNKMFWFQGRIIVLTMIIFVFAWSLAQAAQPQVAARGYLTLGLKSDGTVVAAGANGYGQLNLDSWTNIIQVAAGETHTVGLKSDGTVVAVGDNYWGQLNVDSWTNITQVAAGETHTVGLKSDGTVVAAGAYDQLNVDSWTNIIQAAAGEKHTVGLKSDGTVVVAGDTCDLSSYGKCDVGSWIGITQVAAGWGHTVGLKSDGTVVAVGDNYWGQLNVGAWKKINNIAAGQVHTVGLKADGSVVAVGYKELGQLNVGAWKNIIQVAAGEAHTVGLKADGSVVAVGWNNNGECNTDHWDLGRTPDTFTLTTIMAGAGFGSVTSDPSGINCGIDCSESYQEGSVVTLTASADTGSVFRGWSGGGCSGTGTCVVTMNANTGVTATFTLPTELSPNEGTIGTQLTITGSDFGIKKGKVLIEGVIAKIATDGWADDGIVALLTKAPPQGVPYDVTINLKLKPPLSIILKNAFTVKPPEIDSLNSYEGAVNDPIIITGNFFSTKKGKVYLEVPGGKPKSCKVTSWGMDSITFAVPKTSKSFPAGTYPLKVTNKVGTTYAPSNFTVN